MRKANILYPSGRMEEMVTGEYLAVIDCISANCMQFVIPSVGRLETESNDTHSKKKLVNLLGAFGEEYSTGVEVELLEKACQPLIGRWVLCITWQADAYVDIHDFRLI